MKNGYDQKQEDIEAKQDEIAEKKQEIEDFEPELDDDRYDDMLDEPGIMTDDGMVHIGMLTYAVSQVLKEIDPTAYRCGKNDFIDSMDKDEFKEYQELEEELQELEDELDELENEIEEMKEEEE